MTSLKKQPIPFGKYLLLDRINIGGMAEVWRGKSFSPHGEQLVAVKRILPNIAEDDEFIGMFMDEARISVQLAHSNIAQILDFDFERGHQSYYIAMEYIAGKDLRAVFDRSRRTGKVPPPELVCHVIAKVCEGLDYAHKRKDSSGRDMNIVHRDVSPQNVLLSYDGDVKLIDFGIAKAAGKATRTQAGILKGKFGYMSPEQIRGHGLDRRSDIFSLGACFYELLTGQRLFTGDSDFSVLEKVRKAEVNPPSTVNANIDSALEKIVLKSLARDVENRYQHAGELGEDLQRYLALPEKAFGRRELAAYMRATFAEDVEKEANRQVEYAEMPLPPDFDVAAASAPPSRAATPGLGSALASSQPPLGSPSNPGRRSASSGVVPRSEPPGRDPSGNPDYGAPGSSHGDTLSLVAGRGGQGQGGAFFDAPTVLQASDANKEPPTRAERRVELGVPGPLGQEAKTALGQPGQGGEAAVYRPWITTLPGNGPGWSWTEWMEEFRALPRSAKVVAIGGLSVFLVSLAVLLFGGRERPTGLLYVDVPQDLKGRARVLVGDEDLGIPRAWPLIHRTHAGASTVVVSAEGYESFRRNVDIPERGPATTVEAKLPKLSETVKLLVVSDPAVPEIRINGKPLYSRTDESGVFRTEVRLGANSDVELRAPGYQPFSQTVRAMTKEPLVVRAVLLPNEFFVQVNATPDRASVYLGEELMGLSPAMFKTSGGMVSVRQHCYHDKQERLVPPKEPNSMVTLNFDLRHINGCR